jgi:hypothetical protein
MRLSLLLVLAPAAVGDDGEPLRFNRDVRPILSNHCFECHGPDAGMRKAELRLDLSEGLARVVDGAAPERSELVRRVTHDDPDERMPPARFRHTLDAGERATLVRWVTEGAQSEPHWAYQPPRRWPLPDTVDPAWSGGPIDVRLRARMHAAGVTPAAVADRRTLARRLSFDLVGLPPAPEEVEALVRAPDLDAALAGYAERLFASPHHGERMAVFWLDLVRYADTAGYHGDQEWHAWPYRDWVIRAFNENQPFDAFTLEQLAGDLLPDATLQQRVASGYNRLNMVTFEGGSQAKEFLAKYAADRVRTTAGAWLGSTLGCAECHDHKFDPFTTRDFYSFAAFFADVEEVGVYSNYQEGVVPPELPVPSAEQAARLAELTAEAARCRAALERDDAELAAARAAWEGAYRAALTGPDEAPQDVTWIDDAQDTGGASRGTWTFVDTPVHSGARARRQSSAELVQHFFEGATRAATPRAGDRFFAWVWLDPDDPPQTLMLQLNDGSWEHRAYWGADAIPFGGPGREQPNHRHLGPLPAPGGWARLEAGLEDVGLAPGKPVTGMAFTQFGGTVYWDRAGLTTTRPALAFGGPGPEVAAALEAATPTPEDEARIGAYWRGVAPELEAERAALAAAEQRADELSAAIPRTLVTVATEPRVMRVLPRGNWMDESGPVVQPAPPRFLAPAGAAQGARATRLDLARWLVAPENPLTARVLVNRLWRLFYGEGLARSVDDVGSQGEWPDHLELLDELALDLVESGWDVRALMRRMVNARAYRLSSAPRPELAAPDPDRRLFARQARARLDAEFVRDAALAASGLLVRDVGGKSVKPYQPAGYWRELNFPMRTWRHDTGDGLYRRGLYTFWCRTFLHPTLKAFDAPAREECTARRARSNTPLQALALLNDPTFVEAARVLAERVLREAPDSDDARLARMFALVLSRPPTDAERALLLELRAAHLTAFRADAAAASALATAGEAPRAELEPALVASWTSVARALFNTGEAVSRR